LNKKRSIILVVVFDSPLSLPHAGEKGVFVPLSPKNIEQKNTY
jgi:hypothetical protein